MPTPSAHDIAQRLGPDARIATWQTTNAGIFAALAVQRNVMVIILALIILVAAFNIVSSLVMLVKDKGHDIAILRTIGATKGSVTRIFMLAGTAIGVAGMALGVGLGLVLAAHIEAIHHFVEHVTGQQLLVEDIYFLSSLPTKTEPREVAVIVLLALALSFLARSIPRAAPRASIRAEALRYE
ncbi:MAG: FtsX-like permease family protein [Alphaproteobacteria bacterium]